MKEIAEEEINGYVVIKYKNTILLEQGGGECRDVIPPVRYLMTTLPFVSSMAISLHV